MVFARLGGLLRAAQLVHGPLAFGDVADNAGEGMLAVMNIFADRNLDRDGVPILMATLQFDAFPMDMPLSGIEITRNGCGMNLGLAVRHKHRYSLAQHLLLRI